MAQISENMQKLQEVANNLQNTYRFISLLGNQTDTQNKLLVEQEKKFVEEGLIPYLKEVIEEAAQVLCVPISIKANYNPDKGVQLDADVHTSPRNIKVQPAPQPKPRRSSNHSSVSKGRNNNLRVKVDNGKIINAFNTAETFAQAIIYAMEKVGPENVANAVLQHSIQLDKEPLVKKGPFRSEDASSRELIQGYYTNTHSNTPTKQRQLERISEILNLHWIVTTD